MSLPTISYENLSIGIIIIGLILLTLRMAYINIQYKRYKKYKSLKYRKGKKVMKKPKKPHDLSFFYLIGGIIFLILILLNS